MKQGKRALPYFWLLPSYTIIFILIVFPVLYNMYISTYDWSLIKQTKTFIGLSNYLYFLKNPQLWESLIITIKWVGADVGLSFFVGLGLALILNKKFYGREFFTALMFIPWMIPGVVTALLWRWMFQTDIGMINIILKELHITSSKIDWLSEFPLFCVVVGDAWRTFPFWTVMTLAGLKSIPSEEIEAAQLDGANKIDIFRHITLPHLKPILVTAGILVTIWTTNYFDMIYVMTRGGPINRTRTISLLIYQIGFNYYRFGQAAALAFIDSIIMIAAILLYLSFLRKD